MPLFTISLKSKPETIIHRYMDRSSIEQTNKESKSYLNIEGSYFRKEKKRVITGTYSLFSTFLTYNFIQYLRLELGNKSFSEVKENLSFYLLWKYPPKCVFEIEKLLSNLQIDMDLNWLDQSNINFNNPDWLYELDKSLELSKYSV